MTYRAWRPVSGFPGYEVSDDGEVKSLPRKNLAGAMRRGRILKKDCSRAGYFLVRLAHGGTKIPRLVHRLVLEAFKGECPEGFQARHLNGARDDNRLENLCWGTVQDNRADQKAHGTGIQGARNPKAKATMVDVERVLDLQKFGISQQAIGDWLGFCQTWVDRVLRGRSYLNLAF